MGLGRKVFGLLALLQVVAQTIGMVLLFVTMTLVVDAVLYNLGEVLSAFIGDWSVRRRVLEELELSMSFGHWLRMSWVFVLFFLVVSVVDCVVVRYGGVVRGATRLKYRVLYTVLYSLFLLVVYAYVMLFNRSIYAANPYETPIYVLVAFFTPSLYRFALGGVVSDW